MRRPYKRSPEGEAWMHAPWTCPKCGDTMQGAGKGPHSVRCAKDSVAHFWSRADKNGAGGCWIFNGCRDKWGYAQHGINCRRVQAHRHAYKLAYGPIPAGKLIMHTCDNPPCVNPDHLRTGTDAENIADMARKGRSGQRGERSLHAKLTAYDVREIRRLFVRINARNSNIPELAKRFSVYPGTIRDVVLRLTWAHIE